MTCGEIHENFDWFKKEKRKKKFLLFEKAIIRRFKFKRGDGALSASRETC